MVVATTIAIGVCTAVIASSSSGINLESGKMDNRLIIMNEELVYRSTLPQNSTTHLNMIQSPNLKNINNIQNISENNKTTNNTGTKLNSTTQEDNFSNINNTNTTNLKGNIIGINNVPPLTEPIPVPVTFKRSGTFMDQIYEINISNFPQEPSKPHPRWYEFWLWIEYGYNYGLWCGKVIGWGFNHLDSLNTLYSLCENILSDYRSL